MVRWLWLSGLVIALDQATKAAASAWLAAYRPVEVIPGFFNLTLMHNTGAAFSMLADAGGWQRWFFTALALVVSGVIVAWLRKLPGDERWQAAALSLILGGALGNVIDRIRFGHVVDFIQVYYEHWYFPAFNVADSAITVGAGIFIIAGLRQKKT